MEQTKYHSYNLTYSICFCCPQVTHQKKKEIHIQYSFSWQYKVWTYVAVGLFKWVIILVWAGVYKNASLLDDTLPLQT